MTDELSSSQPFDERVVLTDRQKDVEQLQEALLAAMERLKYDQTSRFAVRLAVEEAVSNAFQHGSGTDPVTVAWSANEEAIQIEVQDEGPGFDPASVPDPTEDENLEIPCGRGLVLMRAFMTEVHFHPPGNRVHMSYRKTKE